jgi:hypothetical protein
MAPQGPVAREFRAAFRIRRVRSQEIRDVTGLRLGRGRLQRGRRAAKAARGCTNLPQAAPAVDQRALLRRDELFESPSASVAVGVCAYPGPTLSSAMRRLSPSVHQGKRDAISWLGLARKDDFFHEILGDEFGQRFVPARKLRMISFHRCSPFRKSKCSMVI